MDVVFLGYNDVGLRIYEWLCDRDSVDILALVSTADQLSLIETLEPELVVSVGFDHLVPERYLDIPDKGCVNLHPSYLPYNRGKSPNVWSIVERTPAGVTLHYMDQEFDKGDVIVRQRVDTSFADTGKSLHERLEKVQFDLFVETWPELECGTVKSFPQSESEGRYHTTADFRELCELNPAEEVTVKPFLDRLRALSFPPFNNAYIEVDGEKYYIDVDIYHESETESSPMLGTISEY